jgi:aminoglycoside 3-N-acetyltransferase
MNKTSLDDIKNYLDAIKLDKNQIILIHSNLFAFGLIEGGVTGVLNLLLKWVGESRTIVMPAFSYTNSQETVWRQQESPSKSGILTENFRKLSGVIRSIHPIHSIAAMGPLAKEITDRISDSSFGERSPFEYLRHTNAYNLSLGVGFPMGGASYLHYPEELLQVPYRKYVNINSKVYDSKNNQINEQFKYYARISNENFEYINDWDKAILDFKENNIFSIGKIQSAKIIYSKIPKACDYLEKKIKENPYYCSRKK